MFNQQELHKIASAIVPAGKSRAVVGTVDEKGAQLVVAMTFRKEWEVNAIYEHTWSGDNKMSAQVLWAR